MRADPFAKSASEALEKLKELRRLGSSAPLASAEEALLTLQESVLTLQKHRSLFEQPMRSLLDFLTREVPGNHIGSAIGELSSHTSYIRTRRIGFEQSGSLFRNLTIQLLADRVFGDEEKADAWLTRPNASLGGQKPLDLLNDEIGTEIVREKLEQIDHGMFA